MYMCKNKIERLTIKLKYPTTMVLNVALKLIVDASRKDIFGKTVEAIIQGI